MVQYWCINRLDRPNRWKKFSEQIVGKLQLVVHRFPAITGESVDLSVLSIRALRVLETGTRKGHEDLTGRNSIGCYLSHLALWEKSVEHNEHFFVFEDDSEPSLTASLDLEKKVSQAILSIEEPFILFFGLHKMSIVQNTSPIIDSTDMKLHKIDSQRSQLYGTHAYLISPSAARGMIYFSRPIEMQVDSYIVAASRKAGVQLFLTEPQMFSQSSQFSTDIQIIGLEQTNQVLFWFNNGKEIEEKTARQLSTFYLDPIHQEKLGGLLLEKRPDSSYPRICKELEVGPPTKIG
ncbi:hypothetical protein Gasu2_33700 [Galdieria sulphuraria]|nr:hypothetical protein Gasu2_33700 [Galdieria sulphuraria]